MRFDKHVFICINERKLGEKQSCGEEHGLNLVKEMKRMVREKGLNIRINKAGCLDACEFGPAITIYPEGTYYGKVQLSDIEEIVESHLVNDQPVNRLLADFSDT